MDISTLTDQPEQSFAVSALWQQFIDKDIEQAFWHYAMPLHARALRRMLFYGGTAYIGLGIMDILLLGGIGSATWAWMLLVRVICASGCFALYRYMGDPQRSPTQINDAAKISGVLCLSGIPVLLWLLPESYLPMSVLMCMVSMAVYVLLPCRLFEGVLICLAAWVAFMATLYATHTLAPEQLEVVGIVLLAVNVFGHVIGQDIQSVWRREFQSYIAMQKQSIRDHLTGCFNRRYLYDTLLPTEIERSRRTGVPLAIVAVDIDHFKAINDQRGHQSGDLALRQCAAVLGSEIRRRVDAVVRFGGEEFLLILPGSAQRDAEALAERLRLALAATDVVDAQDKVFRITASFGVSSGNFAEHAQLTERALIAAADGYLYQAKHGGRNRVCGGPAS